MRLPLIDKEVPLHVDYTGHLVIEIDQYPDGGWPPGLTTRVDTYAGAIFTVSTAGGSVWTSRPKSPSSKRQKGAHLPEAFVGITHNYHYEPNEDSLFDKNQSHARGPCAIPADYWEFFTTRGIVVRHHRTPLRGFFDPTDFAGGPDPQSLRPERLTMVDGGPNVWDLWPSKTSCPDPLLCWSGRSVFFLDGSEDFDRVASTVPLEESPFGVHVAFHHDGQTSVALVDPKSLKPIKDKKILQFYLNSSPPMFEQPYLLSRIFVIPSDQFGSRTSQGPTPLSDEINPLSQAAPHAGMSPGSLGTIPLQAGPALPLGPEVACQQQHGEGDGTSIPGDPRLHPGHDPVRGRADGGRHSAASDHEGTWSDQPSSDDPIPSAPGPLLSRPGGSKEDRQRSRPIPRVHTVRSGDEGTTGRLHHPDHQGGRARLYAITHGIRDRPGGKVQPFNRSTAASSASWAECYSLSSPPVCAQPSRQTADKSKMP